MSRLEEFRRRLQIKQASEQQLAAISAALGFEDGGLSFHDAEGVLAFVTLKHLFVDTRPDLKDVKSVPELVERLGVNLNHIDPELLEAARAADKEYHRKWDEDMSSARQQHRASPEHQQFLAEERERLGADLFEECYPDEIL